MPALGSCGGQRPTVVAGCQAREGDTVMTDGPTSNPVLETLTILQSKDLDSTHTIVYFGSSDLARSSVTVISTNPASKSDWSFDTSAGACCVCAA